MSEIIFYECPACGAKSFDPIFRWHRSAKTSYPCTGEPPKGRMFREEDVRPLVEAARAAVDVHPLDIDQPRLAAASGPFPGEWSR